MTKWTKEEIYNYEEWLGIYLEHPAFNKEGKQICLLCGWHSFYSYDEVVKIAEILNKLLQEPEKLKLFIKSPKEEIMMKEERTDDLPRLGIAPQEPY